jgi:hypothetical protein
MFYVAVINAEGELIDVPGDVLGTHLVIGTVDAPLHDCPYALHAIHGDTVTEELTRLVIHSFVHVVKAESLAAKVLIGMNLGAAFDTGMDRLV